MSGYEYADEKDIEEMLGVEPPVRYEGNTAYVQTARQAMHVADEPCVSYVVVEDPAERIKLQRFVQACIKGIRV